jgi:hypothetical protein
MTNNHINDNGRHVAQIDERLRALAASLADAASMDDFKELFLIIHRPGWTTVVDVAFMHSLIDAAERSVADSRHLRSALLNGARAIAEAGAVAGPVGS